MNQFSLFQNPIELAHSLWKKIIQPGDCVIDATCGKGLDTFALAKILDNQNGGTLHAIDIQEIALVQTEDRLSKYNFKSKIFFHLQSHETFPFEIQPSSVQLIVYNLGYLPGGDKTITTLSDSTLISLENSLSLIKPGGAVSVMAYPGHPEGEVEDQLLKNYLTSLDKSQWCVIYHQFINRKKSPSLYLIQKTVTC